MEKQSRELLSVALNNEWKYLRFIWVRGVFVMWDFYVGFYMEFLSEKLPTVWFVFIGTV